MASYETKNVFRSGYVALIGRPNVGKSTLMNRIIGEKISIVTDKPQTTRNSILGIRTTDRYQVLFLDTPGIHKAKRRLNERMVQTALAALKDADLIFFLVEPEIRFLEQGDFILHRLHEVSRPIYLIINKIDTIQKERILPLISAYREKLSFQEVVPISALTGDGVDRLEEVIADALPEGPPYFPEESLTDVSKRFMIAEMIREKIIFRTEKEIPHSVAVRVEQVKARPSGKLVDVDAVIYVEKDSQKGILIGKGGRMLRAIGSLVRPEVESLLGSQVFLRLWVKVRKDWRSQVRMLRELGYE
ncbi:MAG: GTPase Era [Deltaproteobacteria bacterium]|nr:GTPase Era [Deltaproteobacteria bacterium]